MSPARTARAAAKCSKTACADCDCSRVECCDDPFCNRPAVVESCGQDGGCRDCAPTRTRTRHRQRASAAPAKHTRLSRSCHALAATCLVCLSLAAMGPMGVSASGGSDLRPGFIVCSNSTGECEFSQEMLDSYCNDMDLEDYNMGLHIGAIFIQIGVSFIGTMIPILTRKFGSKWVGAYEFSLFKHLGAGIILATGFIHMLPPAFENLTNVCLPDPWLEYTAYAGLFAMLAILFTQFIQTMAISYLRQSAGIKSTAEAGWTPIASPQTSPAVSKDSVVVSPTSTETSGGDVDSDTDSTHMDSQRTAAVNGDVEMAVTNGTTVHDDSPSNGHSHSHSHSHVHSHHHSNFVGQGHGHGHDHDAAEVEHVHSLLLAHRQHRQVMVYILELGIATHSFIIGLALGVARGSELTALMIALAFHQFFEGMALTATVLDAEFKSPAQALFAVIFYTATTPLGIGIGIAIESKFNPNSPSALLSTGIIEAISAGILIYDSCVNLISAHMTNNPGFISLSWVKKLGAFVAMWIGVTVMSIIGKWA